MKKKILWVLMLVCLMVSFQPNVDAAPPMESLRNHFDYDEAWQIMSGTWYNPETGEKYNLVWKSNDGSECNIINGLGYTNPTKNSLIYFDNKGRRGVMNITYYKDQGAYYGRFSVVQNGQLRVIENCLVKQ